MEQNEADSYHELYMREGAGSPEYQRTIRHHGRMLSSNAVHNILAAHSFSVDDLLNDEHDNITGGAAILPWRLDAALLYAWLGY
jgi:hypothetical protein